MSFSFTRSFAKAKAGVELIGLVIMVVRGIEEIIPESGQGALKVKLALAQIAEMWDQFVEFFGTFDENVPKIRERIKAIVEGFNDSGLFKNKKG